MEILQDTFVIFCCHTCGVVVIELFVRICLLACVSCVTCMEWLAQLGRYNRLRCAFVLIRLSWFVFGFSRYYPGLNAKAFWKKKFFLILCGFNRWLERDIMCFYVFANCPGFLVLFTVFTVFVVIRCELETLNLYW